MKTPLFLTFITCLSITLHSQISITVANMPSSGDTGRYSNAALASVGDYTTTGANHNWDFSTLDSTSQGLRIFKPSSATPYSFYFFAPKYGEKTLDSVPIPAIPFGGMTLSIKNIYSFYKKNGTTSFNAEGLGLTMSGIPIGTTAQGNNDDELYFFPLNYLNRDSSTFNFSTPTFSAIPFTYKKHGYRITEVDGWGTITTPYGTEQCLRVVTTQYSIDTIKISALSPPFNKFGFPNYMRSYQWLTLTEKIPYLEVSGNMIGGNFTPTQARYRDVLRSWVGIKEESASLAISVFPNPSTGQLTIITPQNNAAITAEIVDLQGKTVYNKELSNNSEIANQHHLNVSSLAKGIYVLNLSSKSGKQSLKISIQ
ncbi:MAG: T9SS type A sorting domain-containing protein [Bacteroidota bacterium]